MALHGQKYEMSLSSPYFITLSTSITVFNKVVDARSLVLPLKYSTLLCLMNVLVTYDVLN